MYQFSDKTDNFDFLGPNLPKSEFWRRNFKNLSLDLEPASLRFYDILETCLPKNGFWGRNFKNLILDLESTPPIYRVC